MGSCRWERSTGGRGAVSTPAQQPEPAHHGELFQWRNFFGLRTEMGESVGNIPKCGKCSPFIFPRTIHGRSPYGWSKLLPHPITGLLASNFFLHDTEEHSQGPCAALHSHRGATVGKIKCLTPEAMRPVNVWLLLATGMGRFPHTA